MEPYIPRFDPVDWEQMRLMLDARALAVALIRARLKRRYPSLSPREINLKLVEEVSRERTFPRL